MSTSDDSGATGELRQVDQAARWLDEPDRRVFALWRDEVRGRITRGELAERLETSRGDADVRIQRMRTSLEFCRVLVAAVQATPQCRGLAVPLSAWDGEPGPQWRDRLGRHITECRTCRGRLRGEESVERLLAAAVEPEPVPAVAAPTAEPSATVPAAAHRQTRRRGRKTLVVGLVTVALAGAGAVAYPLLPKRPGPAAEAADVATSATTPSAAPSAPTESTALSVTDGPGLYTFAAAKAYCAGLTVHGGGWTLPTRIELLSTGTPARFFWTSTVYAADRAPRRAWVVSGAISRGADQTAKHRVRCTRAVTTTTALPRVAAGQVVDAGTGLTWQRSSSPAAMAAGAASGYCAALTLGGRSWRLPTVRELASTVDDTRVLPAVDPRIFPGTAKTGWFWAAAEPGKRWALTYRDGSTDAGRATTGFVRCVAS